MKHTASLTIRRLVLSVVAMWVAVGLVACASSPNETSRQVTVELPGDPQAAHRRNPLLARYLPAIGRFLRAFLAINQGPRQHHPVHAIATPFDVRYSNPTSETVQDDSQNLVTG